MRASHPNPFATLYSQHWPQSDLWALFDRTAKRLAASTALIDGSLRLTFEEWLARSERLARQLARLGFGRGDVIAYQLPNWWEAAVVFLAGLRLGATVNPLLPIFRESELGFTLKQSGAGVLFVPGTYRGTDHRVLIESIRADLPMLREVVVVREEGQCRFDDLLASDSAAPLPAFADPSSVAMLIYTSGTTAAPKGVLHTHTSLAAEVMSLERVHALTPADRTLMPSPLTHISGVIHAILAPALLGTSAVLMERWNPAEAVRLIEAERATYMVGAPTFLHDLVAEQRRAPRDVESLRLFSCGGAAVSRALVEDARATFVNCVAKRVYGSTEFPTLTTTAAADAQTRGLDSEGRAIAPAEVRIVDANGLVLDAGEEGEVQGRGPECFVGYADATLNDDSFSADGWYRSGDLGVLDSAGYLRITGRLKEIVIRKGEKISVREVEEAVAAHPAVAEAVVVALPDPDTGERACAAVRLKAGRSLDLASLRTFLATQRLAKQKWPEALHVVDEFPRTESGKVLRNQLRDSLVAAG